MSWIFLALAIILESLATSMLKMSQGFTNLLPSILTVLGYASCFFCLGQSLRTIEMSIAYAIWSAVGMTFITLIGIFCFHENVSFLKILFISLIVISTVGLKLLP